MRRQEERSFLSTSPSPPPKLAHPVDLGWTLFCALLLSCTYPTDAERYRRENDRAFTLTSTQPQDGAEGQPVNPRLALSFSDFPDPLSFAPPALRLLSGKVSIDYTVEVNLIEKRVYIAPVEPLAKDTAYQLEFGADLYALSGRRLDEAKPLRFRTGMDMRTVEVPPVVTLNQLLDDPQNGLRQNCGLPGVCHAPSGTGPARGLDFSGSTEDIRKYLTGTVARGAPDGVLLVKVGDPARSYLIRKLLAWDGFVRTEGYPMPFDPNVPTESRRLDTATITKIQDWIRGGAK